MKKMTSNILVAFSISAMLCGCSFSKNNFVSVSRGKESDATVKKEIKIGDFDKVSAVQGILVIYEQGENPGVASVATTPEAEKYLQVSVKNKCLTVNYSSEKAVKIKGPSIVRVSAPELIEIDLSSAAGFSITGNYKSDSPLDIEMSSGSDFSGKYIQCSKLNLDLSSGAYMSLKSFVGNLSIDCSSGSDAKIENVKSAVIDAEASSGADISLLGVNAEKVKAEASSGADILIKGNVKNISKSASSGGSVKIKNDK